MGPQAGPPHFLQNIDLTSKIRNVNFDLLANHTCRQRKPITVKMATELTVQSERAFQKQPHSELLSHRAMLPLL